MEEHKRSFDPFDRGTSILLPKDLNIIQDCTKEKDIDYNNGKFLVQMKLTDQQWQGIIAQVKDFDIGKWMYDILYSGAVSAKVFLTMKLEELFVTLTLPLHNELNNIGRLKIVSTMVNIVAVVSGIERSMGVTVNVSLTNAICNSDSRVKENGSISVERAANTVKGFFSKLTGPKPEKEEETKAKTSSSETDVDKMEAVLPEKKIPEAVHIELWKGNTVFSGTTGEEPHPVEAPWYDIVDDSPWLIDDGKHVEALDVYRKVAMTKIKYCLKLHKGFDDIKQEPLLWLFIFRLIRLQREILWVLETYPAETTTAKVAKVVGTVVAPAVSGATQTVAQIVKP